MQTILRKTLKKLLKLNIRQDIRAAVEEKIIGQLMKYTISKVARIKYFDQSEEAVLNVLKVLHRD